MEKWQGLIDEMRGMPSKIKSGVLSGMPREFWTDLIEHHRTIADIERKTGLTRHTLTKYLHQHGVEYDQSTVKGECRDRAALEEAIETEIDAMGIRYHPVHLDPGKDWAIMPDVHGYNVDMVWFRRFLAVSEHYGITNLLGAGDFHDFAALSHFATTTRGKMPSINDEISVTTKLEEILAEQFTGECHMLISNHEIRLAKMLRHELNIEWLFGKMFPQTRWVDSEFVYIGDKHGIAVVHPDRAWAYPMNLCNRYSTSNECDVLMAHAHVFGLGYSWSGRRIGCLGGLFDPCASGMEYAWRKFQTAHRSQGFMLVVDGKILPFGEGFVRWGDFGCE